MVLAALLGMVDLLAAVALLAHAFGYPLPHLQAGMALGLIGKGTFFINDLLSIIDICIGIAMLVLLWTAHPMLALALAIYLGLKGIYSFA